MKKILLMIVALVGISTAMMAEGGNANRMFDKGYKADVRVSATAINSYHITTSHGWAFGHGLYLGGGAGFGAEWIEGDLSAAPHFTPSLFLDARWNVLNSKISPYVDVKATQYIDLSAGSTNYGLTPSVGVDLGMFSIGIGYEVRGDRSALQLGMGFNF